LFDKEYTVSFYCLKSVNHHKPAGNTPSLKIHAQDRPLFPFHPSPGFFIQVNITSVFPVKMSPTFPTFIQ